MKLDILDSFATIKVCTGYMYQGKQMTELPMSPEALQECIPIYEEHEGWQQSTVGIETYNDLPDKAKAYLDRLEDLRGHL